MTRRNLIKAFLAMILVVIFWKWVGLKNWLKKLFADTNTPKGISRPKLPNKSPAKPILYEVKVKGQVPKKIAVKLSADNKLLTEKTIEFSPKDTRVKYLKEEDISIISLTLSPEYASYSTLKAEVLGRPIVDQRLIFQDTKEMVRNTNKIEGYTPKISYLPGEEIEFKIHAPKGIFHLSISRYGLNNEVLFTQSNVIGVPQDYPVYAYREGCNWDTSFKFKIPDDWRTGLYSARIWDSTGKSFYISWIIREKFPVSVKDKKNRIAIIASTNTWQAYNPWGGASLYDYRAKGRFKKDVPDDISPKFGQILNTQRPNLEAAPIVEKGMRPSHLTSGEKYVYAWFEREKINYYVFADIDLHSDPKLLDTFGTIVINTHGEYWTKEMYDHLEVFLNRGGNLICLSGNAVYWKTVLDGNLMEVRKDASKHVLSEEFGGRWRELGRPESSILGVAYTTSGIRTYAPYRVMNPDHWIFEGTGVKKGDIIGRLGPRGGASGHETDKRNEYSPKNTVLLAKGLNPDSTATTKTSLYITEEQEKNIDVGIGGGEIVYYDHKAGGKVFSTGSTTYGTSMWVDPVLSRMLKNVINRFTA